jgi:hypothetical protein
MGGGGRRWVFRAGWAPARSCPAMEIGPAANRHRPRHRWRPWGLGAGCVRRSNDCTASVSVTADGAQHADPLRCAANPGPMAGGPAAARRRTRLSFMKLAVSSLTWFCGRFRVQ